MTLNRLYSCYVCSIEGYQIFRRGAPAIAFNNHILVAGERQIVEVVDHIEAADRIVLVAVHREVVEVGHTEVVAAAVGVVRIEVAAHIVVGAARTGVVARTAAEEAAHIVVVAGSLQGRRNYFPSFRIVHSTQQEHQAEQLVAVVYS